MVLVPASAVGEETDVWKTYASRSRDRQNPFTPARRAEPLVIAHIYFPSPPTPQLHRGRRPRVSCSQTLVCESE